MRKVFSNVCLLTIACIICILSCSKKEGSGNAPAPSTPEASINNTSLVRSTTNSTIIFYVSLPAKITNAVSMHYTTVENTAKAGTDFVAASGSVTIPAGETSAAINITISGDSLRGPSQTFFVQIDQPTNCTIKNSQGTGTIINSDGLNFPVDNAGYATPQSYPGYTLVWEDEFNGNTVNTDNWSYEQGGNGWGNNELVNYTSRSQNSFVSNGNLIIEARAENFQGNQYTSARMITKNKKIFKYGRVDIRAKLPKTKGIWPALWMLGNNIDQVGWPACGEIDMMELLGQEPSKMYNTVHFGATPATHGSYGTNYTLTEGSFDQQFHVFSMDWRQEGITMFVDDKQVFSCNRAVVGEPFPFDGNFFFIFNIAVGGNWPGSPDATTEFPQRMIIDYIRVFQK